MKNIFKILFLAIIVPLFFQSCRQDDFSTKTAEPSFQLYNTTLSSNVLYPTMKNNPFRLTWDNTLGTATEYTVLLSTTEDFAKGVTLGKSSSTSFTTTIGSLNDALISAGFAPYKTQRVYIKVVSGTFTSNVISFDVTPYPTTAPVITAPTAGTKLILDGKNPDVVATTVKWTDYNYGTDVIYTVEIAPKGSTNFVTAGTVNNLKMLDLSNKALNDAVLKTGGIPAVAADYDVRVTATTKSAGGTLNTVSNVVTINITPYVAFKNLYLVGDATAAGWNPNNNNQALYRDPVNSNKFYFTGYFKAGQFKLVEVLGQWQPQWGLKGGTVANSDGGDPDTFVISAAGYYEFTIDILAKTYTLTPYAGTSATYSMIGLIGEFTGWGSDYPMEQSAFDAHQWVARDVSLPAGQLKFRANGGWNVNWGPTKALQPVSVLSGQGVQGGENVIAEEGTYDVFFNDIDGRYQFIKK